jgi:hypothetical protein
MYDIVIEDRTINVDLLIDDTLVDVVVSPAALDVLIVELPQGPPGPGSTIPIPLDPADNGKAPVANNGEFVLETVVRSETIFHLLPVTQQDFNALPIPRDPTILYVIGNF